MIPEGVEVNAMIPVSAKISAWQDFPIHSTKRDCNHAEYKRQISEFEKARVASILRAQYPREEEVVIKKKNI